ncbi:CAAX protease self-immunity [Butyrivibrio fibrisolvens DSM 3071]|uniref:CAAX protease self-immunity n=1 Tax=Butyrivibrio fibrisolvens DSM 3071 TaxID=1121131 RepID=A0A1M5ZDL6_BUTFI|nr:CPBP family intramembrane glutamic endopeptidase [Butyrivibrio fibrisolvens]SHI22345.1 CAAX protease self-immunity [Butyrivibrio fibrisolvens DSM 3071]
MTKKHSVLDHPIIGYFVLLIFVMAFSSIGASLIDEPLSKVIPGYAREMSGFGITATYASGIGAAIGVILAAIIFTLWFRPDFKGVLGGKGFLWGIVVMLPFLLADYAGAAIDIHTFGLGNALVAFLSALSPGFTEEAAFRGLGIANYMRTIKSEKQIKAIFWLSTLLFAGVHITNIFSAGNPVAGIFQVVYCVGVGAIFGAVYLRTANLWVVMIAHFTLDFAGLINGYYSSTGGLSTQLVASDWVNLAVSAIGIVTALILLSPKHYPQIMGLWKEKWSR